jgi:hypothetical protein
MKYIKQYEELNTGKPEVGDYVICTDKRMGFGKPEVGDYVICTDTCDSADDVRTEFLTNNIGIIVTTDNRLYSDNYPIRVKYDKKLPNPYEKNPNECICDYDEILYWSKDKEYLEFILAANKYNL